MPWIERCYFTEADIRKREIACDRTELFGQIVNRDGRSRPRDNLISVGVVADTMHIRPVENRQAAFGELGKVAARS